MQKLGETKTVNSSAPIVILLPVFLPPILLLLLGSGSSAAALPCAGSREGSHPARWHREHAAGTRHDRQVGITQPRDCPRFSHQSDPVQSLPPRGITQQGQIVAAATVLWLSYSNLPHLLPLHSQGHRAQHVIAVGRALCER